MLGISISFVLFWASWCTTLLNFTKYALDKEWLVTTTFIDLHGVEFISSIEHKKYPFVGLQYHPEKLFEWNPAQNNPHSKFSVRANRYFYDLLVNLARLNRNAFSKEKDERNALIFNYQPLMGEPNDYFDQEYVFPWTENVFSIVNKNNCQTFCAACCL